MRTGAMDVLKRGKVKRHGVLCDRGKSQNVACVPRSAALSLLGASAVTAIIAAGIYYAPAVVRYLKIRHM